jgi:L-ascorbate metabolism protein UlaG (beta-lactamase superfamily)
MNERRPDLRPTPQRPSGGGNPYYSGPRSPHFDGRLFRNPQGRPPATFRDLVRWQTGGGWSKWPARWPSPFDQAKPQRRVEGSRLVVTMVGHSTLLIQTAGLNILTDPIWSQRASPFGFTGPRRVNPPGIAFEDLPDIDLVLVSHNHYDHLDLKTLARLVQQHGPRIVTPLGNDTLIRRAIPLARPVGHDWDEAVAVGNEVTVHLEPVHHWSARGTRDRRMALWSGFTIETPGGGIFFAGDTSFDEGRPYRRVAERRAPIRLAILPIGAYAPRWFMSPQHQDPDEAVQGMILAGARFAIGCHWGTFRLTNEPIDEPPRKLGEALERHGVDSGRFLAMRPGQCWEVAG